jgi:hypothetical protein
MTTLDELERIATRPQPHKAQWTTDFDAMRRALPDLLKIARAVAKLGTVEPDSFNGQCCPICGRCCERDRSDEPPTEDDPELVRWGKWFDMADARAVAGIKHTEDCGWVLAQKLAGGGA